MAYFQTQHNNLIMEADVVAQYNIQDQHNADIDDLVENCGILREVFIALDSLTDEQRHEVFSLYCRSCGSIDPGCVCAKDC
jgi:hypothetical protein